MIHQLYMPKFGANIESGIIVQWLKKEGEEVVKGEVIASVETSKSAFEIEAEESGVIRKLLAKEEEEIPFNQVIALIGDATSDIEPILEEIKKSKEDKSADYLKKVDDSVFVRSMTPQTMTTEKVRITPAARRLMRENSISEDVFQSLKRDVIREEDVLSFLSCDEVYIYGASTGAKQIIEILKSDRKYKVVGIIDDNPEVADKSVEGIDVKGNFDWLVDEYKKDENINIMIASHSTNREKIYNKIKASMPNIKFPSIVDKRTVLLGGVEIGESSLVEAGVVLGHEVIIKENVIINLGVKMSHNCVVAEHSHVALGACLSGAVVIERNCFIGAGAAINPAVTIGENSMISPNTAVLNDVPANSVVSGNPGKVVGESKRGKQ